MKSENPLRPRIWSQGRFRAPQLAKRRHKRDIGIEPCFFQCKFQAQTLPTARIRYAVQMNGQTNKQNIHIYICTQTHLYIQTIEHPTHTHTHERQPNKNQTNSTATKHQPTKQQTSERTNKQSNNWTNIRINKITQAAHPQKRRSTHTHTHVKPNPNK